MQHRAATTQLLAWRFIRRGRRPPCARGRGGGGGQEGEGVRYLALKERFRVYGLGIRVRYLALKERGSSRLAARRRIRHFAVGHLGARVYHQDFRRICREGGGDAGHRRKYVCVRETQALGRWHDGAGSAAGAELAYGARQRPRTNAARDAAAATHRCAIFFKCSV